MPENSQVAQNKINYEIYIRMLIAKIFDKGPSLTAVALHTVIASETS